MKTIYKENTSNQPVTDKPRNKTIQRGAKVKFLFVIDKKKVDLGINLL